MLEDIDYHIPSNSDTAKQHIFEVVKIQGDIRRVKRKMQQLQVYSTKKLFIKCGHHYYSTQILCILKLDRLYQPNVSYDFITLYQTLNLLIESQLASSNQWSLF
ncbi:Hypothetical_protein [Hexamita inflata]|uniref:Hypothetical_protein n=1 Tax=Hexamita inflata TaxID=28002 RepID=A0ABP1J4Q9_9EUKA